MTPIRSRFYNGDAPTCCENCREPFKVRDTHIAVWHGKDGRYYCAEDCEADALEAAARRRKVFA